MYPYPEAIILFTVQNSSKGDKLSLFDSLPSPHCSWLTVSVRQYLLSFGSREQLQAEISAGLPEPLDGVEVRALTLPQPFHIR